MLGSVYELVAFLVEDNGNDLAILINVIKVLVLLWAPLTLLAGVVCGTRGWSVEQADGSKRFLADQRLSLNALWGVKTLLGLLAAVVISAALLPGWFLLGPATQWLKRWPEYAIPLPRPPRTNARTKTAVASP